jgi:hypothetical protein
LAESAFLAAVAAFLTGQGLQPAPVSIGIAEPDPVATALPAIVLSLEEMQRVGNGLGERSALITDGVLPWSETIDLANPVLPGEPPLNLVRAGRREVILPHGGQVRADGSSGPLGPPDLTVTVAAVNRPVVAGTPTGLQVRADPTIGRLFFATPLPAAGELVATYHLGQWEQTTKRIAGVMRVDVLGVAAPGVGQLSDGVIAALASPAAASAIRKLHRASVIELSSIGAADPQRANARLRTVRVAIDFEQEINRPDSSGGVIRRIPVTTRLDLPSDDSDAGAAAATPVEDARMIVTETSSG